MIRWLLCSLVLWTWSAPAAAQATRPRPDRTVVLAGSSDLQQLNALVAAETFTLEFINHALFLPLMRYKPDLTFEPALARSWQLSGDSMITFQLRRDVRWHDGRRTTAHDVAFTFDRARDTLTAFPNRDFLRPYRRVEVVDSFTVRFTFAPHRDALMVWPELAIMPRHLLDSIPSERLRTAAFNKQPVGNGPFRFVSQRPNDRWVFEANPDFPAALGGRPRLDRLIWRVIPDNTAQVTELTAGEVDLIIAPRAEQFTALDARAELRGVLKPSRRFHFIAWNGRRKPLADPRVRRALMHALDRVTMIRVLRSGYAQIATGPIAPYHWAFDRTLRPLPYNTARAAQLLAAAGWHDRDGDGVREDASGAPFSIELKIPANNPFNRDLAEMVRSDLARVGVRVVARPLDFAALIGDITAAERRFDAAVLGFDSNFRLNLRDAFHSAALTGPFQSASYSNPRVDALIEAADNAPTRAAALPHYRQLQQVLLEEQPWGVLWYLPELIVHRTRLQGAQFDIRGLLVNVRNWSVTGRR